MGTNQHAARAALLCAAAGLGGCATSMAPLAPDDFIPARALANGIQCEFARYMATPGGSRLMNSGIWVVSGSLKLKIAQDRSNGGSVGATIVPYSGVTAGFDIATNVAAKTTRETQVNFSLRPDPAQRQCPVNHATGEFVSTETVPVANGIGVGAWLATLDRINAAGPAFVPASYTYALTFGVTRNDKGGASFKVVPVSVGINTETAREDIQTLSLSIGPPARTPVTRVQLVGTGGRRAVGGPEAAGTRALSRPRGRVPPTPWPGEDPELRRQRLNLQDGLLLNRPATR